MDDCVIFSRKGSWVYDRLVLSLKDGKEKFDFKDEGKWSAYLEVDIQRHQDGRFELSQSLKIIHTPQDIIIVQSIILPALLPLTNDDPTYKTYNQQHCQLLEGKDDIVPHLVHHNL